MTYDLLTIPVYEILGPLVRTVSITVLLHLCFFRNLLAPKYAESFIEDRKIVYVKVRIIHAVDNHYVYKCMGQLCNQDS